MIIGSPPCTLFLVLQGLNQHKNGAEWNESFQTRKREAVRHVEFCAALYRLQSAPGRYWLYEHPIGASSWNLKTIAQLLRLPGVTRVRADQCAYGLTATVNGESRPAMKPTGFLTNSWCVARELNKRCPGNHKHFSFMEGRAKDAEQHPRKLCQAICRGVSAQKIYDKQGTCCSKGLNVIDLERIIHDAGRPTHWRDDIHHDTKEDQDVAREVLTLSVKNGDTWTWDDVSGASLPVELVKEARRLEIEYVRKMGVYMKLHKSAAKGPKVVGLTWIDTNKMDAANPMIRSRVVAREFNDGVDPNLFAATPPIEALRYILSKAATKGDSQCYIMLKDVSRAFFNAKVTREVYVKLPPEDVLPGEENMVGRLNLCLYGTRDAAMQWQECVAENLTSLGFQRSPAFPSLHHHPEKG